MDLHLFWNSTNPEMTKCLRYYGFDLLPILIFAIVFLIDLLVNRPLKKRNSLAAYFKTYYFRSFIQSILIGSCLFELIQTFDIYPQIVHDPELFQLLSLVSFLKLSVYVILFLFDITHYLKNIGISCFSSLVVSIDWFCKIYLLLEISYLHPTSYLAYELVVSAVQATCVSLLFISYVFLPNRKVPEVTGNSSETSLIDSLTVPETCSNKQKSSNGFFIHKKSLFSQIMFFYFEPFVLFGYRNNYNVDNIMPLEEEFKVISVLADYEANYKNKYKRVSENYNILHLTLHLYKKLFAFNLLLVIIQILLSQFDPQIIKWIITFVRLKEGHKWHGYVFVVALFFNTLTRITVTGVLNRNMNYLQTKMQIILVNHIYKKALKRSTLKDEKSFDTYNLMTVDVNNILDALYFSYTVVIIPLNAILSIYFIYNEIDVAIFYSLLVLLFIGPLTYFLTQKTKRAQKRTMIAKDSRLKFLSDLINGIRTVKLNYFDEIFKRKVTEVREDEVKNFKVYQLYFGVSSMIYYGLPVLLSALAFCIYLFIDERNILTPERAFTTINYFQLLKSSFVGIPQTLHLIVKSVVAAKRIQSFLGSDEQENYITREFDRENAVVIEKNVNFSWESNPKPSSEITLKNLNLKIKKNNHIALVTETAAAGRSSFLSCLLGEMKLISNDKKTSQRVNISKDMRIAFVDSKPWIEKKTIKENIIFGMPFDKKKYNYVLDRCLIRSALVNYANADDQIMDRDSVDLEFNQKVCLARAYYSEANLILLDDFLSIFNDHSADVVFDSVINRNKNGLFEDKTVIMVLNRIEYVKHFDQILAFKNGEISSKINSNELATSSHIENQSADLIYKRSISSKLYNFKNLDSPVETKDLHDEKNCKICSKKLIDDDAEVTNLGWPVYKLYFSTWPRIWLYLMVIGYFASILFQIFAADQLSYWSSNPQNVTGDALNDYNLTGLAQYVILNLLVTLFFTVGNFSAIYGEVKSATKIHKLLLSKVLKLPLFFFDRTPTGSIVNRFSRDIDTVDQTVPFFLKLLILVAFQILSVVWVIVASFPIAIIIIILMMIVYVYLFKIFLKTIIAGKRLELQTRTGLYNRFEELSSGFKKTILAYDKSKLYTQKLNQNLEQNVKCSLMIYIAFKWLALRTEMIGTSILIATTIFTIYNKETLDSGTTALILNFAITLSTLLMALMGLVSEFFINFVSIERIYKYLQLEEEEDSYNQLLPPVENWPAIGKIKFENYSSTYTECRESSLSNLDFEIVENSLVSIVGKSSGKSTLALSIFNAVKHLRGKILIDDVDVTKISLESLRRGISIFPQDVSLFTGKIRFNLDPEDRYTDSELWRVLEYVNMKEQVLCLQGNLNYEIDGQKSALSLGQRQLLGLARTFLKPSKVMIIDETDCQFDLETETRLRKLFKTVFKNRTILLITKNIEHIQAADKVLFLNNGHVRDFKTPDEIFGDKNDNFQHSDRNNNDDMIDNTSDILDLLNNNE